MRRRRFRKTKPWGIDELAHAGREHLDPDFVAGYDRKQGFDPPEDIEGLLPYGRNETATLRDPGAGTRRPGLGAAPHGNRVVGVDVPPARRAFLRDRVEEAGLTNVECIQAGFLTYEHTGLPADAVYTRNALHQLPDFWKAVALDRMARILRPGGVLRLRDLIYDFQPAEAGAVLHGWLAGAVDDPATGYTAAEYATHIRTEYSTFRWLLEPMLTAAGFDIVSVDYVGRLYGAYTCIRNDGAGYPDGSGYPART